jgi:hypothetical protein
LQPRLRLVDRESANERKELIMYRLVTIGALIAALAAPASAAGHGARAREARAQIACPQNVVIPPGRGYGMCGHRFWVRDPQTGRVKAIPFWRLQRLNDPSEDRP